MSKLIDKPGIIHQVIKEIVNFFKETLDAEGTVVIKTERANDGGWLAEAEVIERSAHMRKIGLSKPVYDKNFYRINLDKNLNVISYARKSQKSDAE